MLVSLNAPENISLLRLTLRNHFVKGLSPSTNIPEGSSFVTSLVGLRLTFNRRGDAISVENFKIISPDQLAYNGLVHTIDGVLTV